MWVACIPRHQLVRYRSTNCCNAATRRLLAGLALHKVRRVAQTLELGEHGLGLQKLHARLLYANDVRNVRLALQKLQQSPQARRVANVY